jgi:hypothetical protein
MPRISPKCSQRGVCASRRGSRQSEQRRLISAPEDSLRGEPARASEMRSRLRALKVVAVAAAAAPFRAARARASKLRSRLRALKVVAVAAEAAPFRAARARASESGGRGEAAPPPVASAQIRHSIKPKHLFERHDRRIRAGDVIAHDKTDALTLSEALTTLGLSEELSSRRSVAWSLSR